MAVEQKPRTLRERYGAELRLRRLAAGLTQEELGAQLLCSSTLVSHWEAGRRLPNPDDAQRIDLVLKTDGFFFRWLEDLDPRFAQYFKAVIELEREASEIRQYGALLIPGLLQTEAYALAVYQAYRPNYSAEQLDEYVVKRMERGQLLTNSSSPVAWTLLDEAALRRTTGGPGVMAEQLHKVADMAEAGRLRLHVLTFASGAHALLQSMVYLLDFAGASPVAYVEGILTGHLMDQPTEVEACQRAYVLALSNAASCQESVALVRNIAREYEHAHHAGRDR
ncbi:helix-turn-helix transcriptional regulator [Streptomyces sp. NBC_00102]|uniref:helix-turn-helix domain-containing protein n=1 Tax=Streptomyces sp. NBC_00102 TaxID=2975652 RepID=UPI00224D8A22|nr:helix-turn-helix transcriptional regulator [Streptomyces sp. NBC_00102]MCX5397131.1 helix-turn-helix transcriptional regulator [Streptomyces sp. NBC_00102]